MELRDIVLALHIAAAGTWLGANIVQAVAPPLATRQGPATAAGWFRMTIGLSKRLYIPAGVLVLLSGIVLVLDSEVYTFGSLFVGIGLATVVIGALLGSFVFEPGAEKAAQAIESGDQAAIGRATSRLAAFGMFDTLLVLFTIAVMVLRWT